MPFSRLTAGLIAVLFLVSCAGPLTNGTGVAYSDSAASRAAGLVATGTGIKAAFAVTSDWTSGYTTTVTLTNTGTQALTGWTLEWANSPALVVQNSWSATLTTSAASTKAVPLSYNAAIPPAASVTFGYNAAGSSATAAPTWVKFNGVTISSSSSSSNTASTATTRTRPVDKYGQLKVVGNKIVDKNGAAVQLRGVSSHGLQWFPFVDNQTVKNLSSLMGGVDVIRGAMYVKEWDAAKNLYAGYLGANPEVRSTLINVIQDAIDEGIYVIVDWHIHWNPPTAANTYWTNDPYTDQAVTFFKDLGALLYKGKALKDYPNVIWEVMNEPGSSISWSQVKTHAGKVIKQIRTGNGDADNLILVPATNWAQDLDVVAADSAADRPDRVAGNVVYTLHFYAASHGAEVRAKAQAALNAGLAVFADEWGTGDYTGNGTPSNAASQTWVTWMNDNKISWANWNFSDKGEASALLVTGAGLTGPWTSAQLSTSGQWVKNWIVQGK